MKRLAWSMLAGLVLFIWGFISHNVLPWYDPVYNPFTDEARMSAALKRTAPVKGLYYLPFAEPDRRQDLVEAFVNVIPAGTGATLPRQLAVGFLTSVLSAFLVLTVVSWTRPTTRRMAVTIFALVGLTIGYVSHVYYWNWFQFPFRYLVVTTLDSVAGWALAGAVASGFVRKAGS